MSVETPLRRPVLGSLGDERGGCSPSQILNSLGCESALEALVICSEVVLVLDKLFRFDSTSVQLSVGFLNQGHPRLVVRSRLRKVKICE